MHTERYKHSILVDWENIFEQGIGSIVEVGGEDRTMARLLAPNLFVFLE
jgi:hypothetical protein